MKKYLTVITLAVILITAFLLTGCLGYEQYDSIAKTVDNPVIDESIPLIGKDEMSELLLNPDRGLRMETYITLGDPLRSYPPGTEDPYERAKNMIEKYKSDSPTLCQTYVYLTNYYNKPLDNLALTQLKEFFELFRDNGIRILLRFAYQTENVPDATYDVMKDHIRTLDGFFESNEQLIEDTVYALQLGMIGYWGEGHSFKNFDWNKHSNALVKDMCEFADEHDLYLQVRTMDIYSKVPLWYRDIVGMHDDYIIDDLDNEWAFLPASDGRYKRMMKKFSNTINDGEMPWGDTNVGDTEAGASTNSMDGKTILQRLYANSMTSFSLEHNYREKPDSEFSMYKWRSEYLTYEEAKALGISVNKRLFDVNDGKLSIYDILTYHLGYQLTISNLRREDGVLSFMITNYGFAAPLKAEHLAIVTSKNGILTEHEIDAYEPEKLKSGVTVRYDIRLDEDVEVVGVRMALDDDSKFTVRFANGTRYENGVQYFA